jgi:hypothetical protein
MGGKEGSTKRPGEVEIIMPPDDLRRKVGGGRPSNPKAVEAILDEMNRVMETQKGTYKRVVRVNVDRFHRLAEDSGLPADYRRREMKCVAHELRGIAGTFGYVLVGRIADSFCDYVAAVDDGGLANVEVEKIHANAMSRALSAEGPLDKTSLAVLEGLRLVITRSLQKGH